MIKDKEPEYYWRVTFDNGLYDSKEDAEFTLRKFQRRAKRQGLKLKKSVRVWRQKNKWFLKCQNQVTGEQHV